MSTFYLISFSPHIFLWFQCANFCFRVLFFSKVRPTKIPRKTPVVFPNIARDARPLRNSLGANFTTSKRSKSIQLWGNFFLSEKNPIFDPIWKGGFFQGNSKEFPGFRAVFFQVFLWKSCGPWYLKMQEIHGKIGGHRHMIHV